jgi:hypothetical protein
MAIDQASALKSFLVLMTKENSHNPKFIYLDDIKANANPQTVANVDRRDILTRMDGEAYDYLHNKLKGANSLEYANYKKSFERLHAANTQVFEAFGLSEDWDDAICPRKDSLEDILA